MQERDKNDTRALMMTLLLKHIGSNNKGTPSTVTIDVTREDLKTRTAIHAQLDRCLDRLDKKLNDPHEDMWPHDVVVEDVG